jgi:hypothetical protein
MKETEFTDQVRLKLHEFETIDEIQPSSDWNQSLMNKLNSASSSVPGMNVSGFTVLVLFIVFVNIGSMINTIIRTTDQTQQRDQDLKTVVREFLINPDSVNN